VYIAQKKKTQQERENNVRIKEEKIETGVLAA